MTKDSKFVKARYLDKDLPPEGTMTELECTIQIVVCSASIN